MNEMKNETLPDDYLDEVEHIVDGMSLMDDDLMSKVFEKNIPASELLLSTLLGEKVTVSESNGQVEMNNPLTQGRNITVDILAKDECGRLFNCEVQRRNSGADPRRVRFHSSMLDVRALKESEDFKDIRDTYVIFITQNDYFKAGEPLYYVNRKVKIKDYEVPFDDGNVIIYVNGSYDGDDEIGHLMSDFRNKTLYGFYNKEIEDAVRHFKTTEGGRDNMCDAVQEFAERYAKEYAKKYAKDEYSKGVSDGREEGIKEGIKEGAMEGRDETLFESIRNVMKNLKVSAEQAMQTLGIPESDYQKFLSRL